MPITLKHINYSDSDNIKLDKVNYNFDQLVANGGGPMGPQGATGQNGPQGTTGHQGFQGPLGTTGQQGTMGPISDNFWKRIEPDAIDVDTLIPIYTSGNEFAPVVNIGFMTTNTQYGTKAELERGLTPYQWIINRKQYAIANLRFLNSDIPGNGYEFKLEKLATKDQMNLGFIYPQDSTSIYKAGITNFRSSSSTTNSLIVNDSSATFTRPVEFNSPVIIKEQLFIENANADTDKIATSEDTTGLVKFKTVQELGGTVPYGTIVSISPSIFADDGNFVNNEQYFPGNFSPISISIGKGVNDYEGWYLCHGYTWTDGTTDYPVPMLGKFNYSIDDNPFSTDPSSQGSASTENKSTHITGGSDIDMTATSVPTLVYNITSTVDTSSVSVDPGTGTTFKIKQLPQIIYLGRNDLYWFDLGTGQEPSVPLTWLLDDANAGPSKLNPDPYSLGTISNQPEGASYSFTTGVEAPNGYYWSTLPTSGDITGLPAWATVTGITLSSGTYPTTISITINVSSHPAASPNPSPETLNIDTTGFISASAATIQLEMTGSPGNTTVTSPPFVQNISYNFATGYTYTIVVNANSGYYFAPNPPASITSFVGGGTYTINSVTYSNPLTIGHGTLTINVTITGVTFGTTNLTYGLTVPVFSSAPRITNNPGFPWRIIGTSMNPASNETGNDGLYTTLAVTVENNTGAPVYIWAGINNFSTGPGPSNVSVQCGYQSSFSPVFNLNVPIGPINATTYSASSYPLPNNTSITATLYRVATTDAYHYIQLYWSSTLGGPKQQITS